MAEKTKVNAFEVTERTSLAETCEETGKNVCRFVTHGTGFLADTAEFAREALLEPRIEQRADNVQALFKAVEKLGKLGLEGDQAMSLITGGIRLN